MKNKKPSDFGLNITDLDFVNKNETFKKRNRFKKHLSKNLKIQYDYHTFSSRRSKEYKVIIVFIKGNDIFAAITSYIFGSGTAVFTAYGDAREVWSKDVFLEKMASEPLFFEWCLWNI